MKVTLLAFGLRRGFTIRDLAAKMLSCPFVDSSDCGFDIERATKDFISGVYLSRRAKRINIRLPNGEIEVLTRDSIERFDFEISKPEGRLLLFDPGYESKSFVSALASQSKFQVKIESYDTRIERLADLYDRSEFSFAISKIFLDGISFAKRVEGGLVASGELSSEALRGSIGRLKGKVSRVELSWPVDQLGHSLSVSVADTGRFEIKNCECSKIARSVVAEVLSALKE